MLKSERKSRPIADVRRGMPERPAHARRGLSNPFDCLAAIGDFDRDLLLGFERLRKDNGEIIPTLVEGQCWSVRNNGGGNPQRGREQKMKHWISFRHCAEAQR